MMLWTLLYFSFAGLSAGSGLATEDKSVILPSLQPKSDQKFFGKDYQWDKRPAVDVLHFKHPYPVVQDNDEFDRDFVKDENKDDGSFKAQSEYDRLRHKLAKEKEAVEKASKAKTKAESELKDAVRREEAAVKKREEAIQKEKEEQKKREEAAQKEAKEKEEKERKHGLISGPMDEKKPGSSDKKEEQTEKEDKTKEYTIIPGSKIPGGVTSPGSVDAATGDTEKAMDSLEKCKKQLREAREKLKKLMKELEEAKEQQQKTQAALDADSEKLEKHEEGQIASQNAARKEYQEFVDAQEAYTKQQVLVEKMEADIKSSAAKVKAFRDAEDKNGGVVPTSRNGAIPHSIASVVTVLIVSTMGTMSLQ